MTIPGPALFYAGMVHKKNVLAIMMQSFILCATGGLDDRRYAFTDGNARIGDTSRLFLNGIAVDSRSISSRRRFSGGRILTSLQRAE